MFVHKLTKLASVTTGQFANRLNSTSEPLLQFYHKANILTI